MKAVKAMKNVKTRKKVKIINSLAFLAMLLSLAILTSCTPYTSCTGIERGETTADTSDYTETPTGITVSQETDLQTPVTTDVTEEPYISIKKKTNGGIGVWWWNAGLAVNAEQRAKYLDFLGKNQVSEIYFCPGNYSDDIIAAFVTDAGQRGMRCSWLTGDASWLKEGNNGPDIVYERFMKYQSGVSEKARFYGIHFDVEPHQNPDFLDKRDEYQQSFSELVSRMSEKLSRAGYESEWDIAFWFDSDTVTDKDGETIPLIESLAMSADTLCLMSYRNKGTAVIDLSKEEIAAGKKYSCRIVCGVECYSEEGADVSFAADGKRAMYRELSIIYKLLEYNGLEKYGVAVHYLDTWYKLAD